MKKKVIIGAGIVLFIAIVVILNLKRGEEKKSVEAEVVKAASIVSRVRVEGTLKAENQVGIGSDVLGRLTKILVKEGDRVEKGTLLCTIDPRTYDARLAQARAQLRASQSRLAKAELDVGRYSQLLEEKLVSEEEYEGIRTQYDIYKAQVETEEFAVREARENLNKTTLRSPIAGEIVSLNKEEGEMVVMGTIGTPGSVIMIIAERSKMFVRAMVDETEIVRVEVGQEAEVEVDAFPDTTFSGHVARIGGMPVMDASASDQAVSFPVEVALEPGVTKLYPGMSATCNIIVAKKDSVLLVPYSSLGRREVEDEEKDILFTVESGVAKLKPVTIGVTGDKEAEIEEGLSLGDTVLVGPYKTLRELKDGDRVKVELKKDKDKDKEKDKDDADRDEGDNESL
ncbi:efflux RND transporter periplasmic adaptor subunit [candidate division TA06 bacterium]|uniref:Efflux RND transporter periplasmic adaptor subunit n=1 Tax=candidate division TA06 bacterium TaxID=2250710 RepID=A0A523UYM4_UNCT6|nr:MAG: efflux RND transporter periplasmic adaptor subunit [candidate division TA06 bacterium]